VDGTVTAIASRPHALPARTGRLAKCQPEWLYYQQQTISLARFPVGVQHFVPHTCALAIKQCSDCQSLWCQDNNAWMAQLRCKGTNFESWAVFMWLLVIMA
jgi:hypothetical protein